MDIAIEISNLKKSYRNFLAKDGNLAVQNLNLSIQKGEVWALVGPNGAGKSTTLYCLTGLFHPDAGSIRIFNQDPHNAETRKIMGFQSEIFFTYAHLTAQEVLRFYGSLQGMKDPALSTTITNLLNRVGLGNVSNRKVGSFSKGMTQRLGLAQSLIHDPSVVIWDEPSSGLDPEGRILVIELLKEMKAQGKTVLFSTHVLDDIEKVSDHIAIISSGKIMAADAIEALMQKSGGKNLEEIYMQYAREMKHV